LKLTKLIVFFSKGLLRNRRDPENIFGKIVMRKIIHAYEKLEPIKQTRARINRIFDKLTSNSCPRFLNHTKRYDDRYLRNIFDGYTHDHFDNNLTQSQNLTRSLQSIPIDNKQRQALAELKTNEIEVAKIDSKDVLPPIYSKTASVSTLKPKTQIIAKKPLDPINKSDYEQSFIKEDSNFT
jgi:hypothetical protein